MPNYNDSLPVGDILNMNLDRTVTPPLLTHGLMGKSGSSYVAVQVDSSGRLQSTASGDNLTTNTTSAGNTGSGEDTLIAYTVSAGQLATNGDYLEFNAAGTFAATSSTKAIKVYFGGTTIYDSGVLALSAASPWNVTGQIIRTGAATAKCYAAVNGSTLLLRADAGYAASTDALSAVQDLKMTATCAVGSDNDVVQQLLTVRYIPV